MFNELDSQNGFTQKMYLYLTVATGKRSQKMKGTGKANFVTLSYEQIDLNIII